MAKSSACISLLDYSVTRWIADNFYLCEGCTAPRWLLYELCMESCSPDFNNQLNPSKFGKLVRLVFPGLQTRRLGKRGSSRYHYVGIAIKNSSSYYTRYCCLLKENNYPRDSSLGEASSSTQQLSTYVVTSGNTCSAGDACGYKSNDLKERTSKTLHCFPTLIYLNTEPEMPLPESSRSYIWEQDVWKKNSYEMVELLARDYSSHCEDILNMVRNNQLNKVESCIISFWRSLQLEAIALLSLPYVCQLFKSYDRLLYKEIEDILFHDFLEEVPLQYMKSIRLFGENIQVWLFNALEGLPSLLQTSKSEELKLFIKRLKRKTDLSSIAKTMTIILNSKSKVTVLRSSLYVVINHGLLEVPGNSFQTKSKNPEELQNNIGLKCLNDLLPLLAPYTDIRLLLNCVSVNLQAFVIQPSKSKEEFRKLASDFQLKWNFLLNAVSKAVILNCGESFGYWHLFNLLLMDYVAHVFQSYIEDEDEYFWHVTQNEPRVLPLYEPSHLCNYFAEEEPQDDVSQIAPATVMQSQNNFGLSNVFGEF